MTVSLSKGQTVSLAKRGGGGLDSVTMGLGWSPAKTGGGLFGIFKGAPKDIDLDASCLAFAGNRIVGKVWFPREFHTAFDGAIQHSGDNRTGAGDGDDESIRIALSRLPAEVDRIALTVNSYQGQTFNEVEDAVCRVVDNQTGAEIARFELREKGSHTGVVMAILSKDGSGTWSMQAIGSVANGRTVDDLIPAIVACFK